LLIHRSINRSQSAVTAQLALQHSTSAIRPLQPQPDKTEKEKMLGGEFYQLYHPQLVDERDACKARLYRFNNANNPHNGASREERARLFREILEPPNVNTSNRSYHPSNAGPDSVRLGTGVVVEAPFTCDYGFNIDIGNDTVISAGCTISDPCNISIGARCILGPNVQIYGNGLPSDPRMRNGSKGNAIGKRIWIEDDCFIGGNATILGGVHIGKGSVVGAGAVVTKVSLL